MPAPQTLAKFAIGRKIVKDEHHGNFTAERLRKRAPHVVDAIVKLRAEGFGYLKIADILHVDHRTAKAVDLQEPGKIEAYREKLKVRIYQAADVLLEIIETDPSVIPKHLVGLVFCQLLDKAEQLDNRKLPTQVTFNKIDIFNDWPSFLQSLPTGEAMPMLEAKEQPEPASASAAMDSSAQTRPAIKAIVSPTDETFKQS